MRAKKAVFVGLVLTWAFVTLLVYYVFHKPIHIDQVMAIGKTLWGMVSAGLVILAGAAVGRTLFARLNLWRNSTSIESLAMEIGLGLGWLGLVWLVLGLLGGFHTIVAWAVLLGISLITHRDILDWCHDLLEEIRGLKPRSRGEVWLGAFVIFMVITAFVSALTPPTAWDALLYHLTGPKINIASGWLEVTPQIPETGYPQGMEMLNTWVMMLGSPRAAAVLQWFFGILTLLLVWRWGEKIVGSHAGWLACAILLTATTYPLMMGWAYIDVATIFYTATGFSALMQWKKTEQRSFLVLAGLSAGFAFGTKYTGVVIGMGLVVLILIAQPRKGLRNLIVFGLPAVLVSVPWLIKNFILVGNPTYPFFFGGLGWDEIRSYWYSQPGTGLLYTAPWKLLVAPFIMTLVGAEGAKTWHATFGPLFILFVPLIVVRWKDHRHRIWLRDALILSLVIYLAWLYGAAVSRLMVQPRFLFPALPLLAVLSAAAYESLRSIEWRLFSIHRILGVFIGLVLILTALQTGLDTLQNQDMPVLAGAMSEEDYLYHRLGWYFAAVEEVRDLPEGSQVLFLFEPRSYYCPPDRCLPDGILDIWYHARGLGGTSANLARTWQEQGVSHVLLYALGVETLKQKGVDPFTEEDWSELERLQDQHMTLVKNFGDAYLLYELTP
ncbi:MAG: hypothetical protein AMJ88_04545 [Anaerolineae bacterium SM23_ 63]|nr:MAG: hypothetical protein AMJ88_04545 [Anaerolineae bacterium SM23_ 63]HEY45292.1 hypothetical protein [Anaerolineae bacterium]